MGDVLILDGIGEEPVPSSAFVKQLRIFDVNLRVVWGGKPYLRECWVIERRVPRALYYKTYLKDRDTASARFSEQTVITNDGRDLGKRRYDMMPDFHPVYFVVNAKGEKLDLGEHVIDHLRRNYERTLLGFPELAMKHLAIDRSLIEADRNKRKQDALERAAREVMNNKYSIWSEYFAFGGQPRTVMPGTECDSKKVN